MKEQLDLVLPGPSFLAHRWRNLLVHGRVLNLGYLAILVACLWKILAAVAAATVLTQTALERTKRQAPIRPRDEAEG